MAMQALKYMYRPELSTSAVYVSIWPAAFEQFQIQHRLSPSLAASIYKHARQAGSGQGAHHLDDYVMRCQQQRSGSSGQPCVFDLIRPFSSKLAVLENRPHGSTKSQHY